MWHVVEVVIRGFNLVIEILIVDRQPALYFSRSAGNGFNLVIEILIVDRQSTLNPTRQLPGFNLVIEILIVDRDTAALAEASWLSVSIS